MVEQHLPKEIRRAVLEDTVTGEYHDLQELVLRYGTGLTIGRNPDRNIIVLGKEHSGRTTASIPANLIDISDEKIIETVSRTHAILFYDLKKRVYGLRDDFSKNETLVRRRGELHTLEKHKSFILNDNDEIWCGAYHLNYRER